MQLKRFGPDCPTPVNAAMASPAIRQYCRLDTSAQALLDRAFESLGLSARSITRILKVARTLADLAGLADPGAKQVAEAVQYRALDRRTR